MTDMFQWKSWDNFQITLPFPGKDKDSCIHTRGLQGSFSWKGCPAPSKSGFLVLLCKYQNLPWWFKIMKKNSKVFCFHLFLLIWVNYFQTTKFEEAIKWSFKTYIFQVCVRDILRYIKHLLLFKYFFIIF